MFRFLLILKDKTICSNWNNDNMKVSPYLKETNKLIIQFNDKNSIKNIAEFDGKEVVGIYWRNILSLKTNFDEIIGVQVVTINSKRFTFSKNEIIEETLDEKTMNYLINERNK